MSTLAFRALSGSLGGEVSGLDLSNPLDDQTFAAIKSFWLERVVFVARGLDDLTPEQLVAFTRRFGEPHVFHVSRYTMPGNPEVYVISNVVENGKPLGATGAGTWWHTDEMYLEKPAHCTLLYGKEVPPEGGDTIFADMYAAYAALSEAMRDRIDRLQVVVTRVKTYESYYPHRPPLSEDEKAALPDVVHPLVRVHPETGRKALFCGGGEAAWNIVGLPLFEGQALLRTLRDFATLPRFVYAHEWRPGDLLVWDNRCALHAATLYDTELHRRIMYRTTVHGEAPIAPAQAAAA